MAGASGPTMSFGKRKKRAIWDDPDATEVISIPLEQLHPNPFNPRIVYRDEDIESMAESMKAEGGLLQDLSVAEVGPFLEYWRERLATRGETERAQRLEEALGSAPVEDYVLLIGHNRRAALERAGIAEATAKVTNSKIPRARLLGLPENMQRVPLNAIEEATGYQEALSDGLTQSEVAQQTGCRQPHISRRVKLLKLPHEVQKAVMDGLPVSEAEVLLDRLDSTELRREAWNIMQAHGLKAAVACARALQPSDGAPGSPQGASSNAEGTSKPEGESLAEEPKKIGKATAPVPSQKRPKDEPAELRAAASSSSEPETQSDPGQEASLRRRAACKSLVQAGVPSNPRETLRLVAPALVMSPDQEARRTAHAWLTGVQPPVGPQAASPEEYFALVAKWADSKLSAHVAFALALAVSELRATSLQWDDLDREYLSYLTQAASYEPSDWERTRLTEAAPK